MENHNFLQPLLLPSSTTNTSSSPAPAITDPPPPLPPPRNDHRLVSSNSGIIMRFALVFFIGMVSIWANHEASKGFAITIVNESGDTVHGKRFQLFYVSNDEATRMIIRTSRLVENFLYSDSESHIKTRVDHIIVKLASQNLTNDVIVHLVKDGEFVLNISPSVMDGMNFGHVMSQVVQRGVADIWIWDGQGNAPKNLVNGIIEYITSKLGRSDIKFDPRRHDPLQQVASCNWKHDDPNVVAGFLDHCEHHQPGFIRRLNQGIKDEWHDRKLEIALGLPIQNLCATNGSRLGTTFSA